MIKEITFSGNNPVTINYTGSAEDYFAPIHTSSCDLTFVTNEIMTDIYSAEKDDLFVEIERDGEIIWEGYITPNTFSQEVSQNLDKVSVTCIDPLALLKYIKVSEVFNKVEVLTIGKIFGRVLNEVIINTSYLSVEQNVLYVDGDSTGNLMSLKVNLGNFWDESDESITCDVLFEDILKTFCKSIFFTGKEFRIVDCSNTTDEKEFITYYIINNGEIDYEESWEMLNETNDLGVDYKVNNISSTNVTINGTYGMVKGTISTKENSYGESVWDKVKPTETNKYFIGDGNVLMNKCPNGWDISLYNGSMSAVMPPPYKEKYQYIFNGDFVDDDYELSTSNPLNGYNNINKLNYYCFGVDDRANDSGSVLQFYGQKQNQFATSPTSPLTRDVDVHNVITTFAPDNGIPPEFLKGEDLTWTSKLGATVTKPDRDDEKWGRYIPKGAAVGSKYVYKQSFPNIVLQNDGDQKIDINYSWRYSRTGFPEPIPMVSDCNIVSASGYPTTGEWYPEYFKEESVIFNAMYYNQFKTNGYIEYAWGANFDWHEVYLILDMGPTDNNLYFDGVEWTWVPSTIKFGHILNGEQCFQDDKKPDYIQIKNGKIYALNQEARSFFNDKDGNYIGKERQKSSDIEQKFDLYDTNITKYVDSVESGKVSIILPKRDKVTATLRVLFKTGFLFGTTGKNFYNTSGAGFCFYSKAVIKDPARNLMRMFDMYGDFVPYCVTYCKAEHSDINISVVDSKSNLGQLFSNSDIEYSIKDNTRFFETYEDLSFNVNTLNPIVSSSQSYLMYGNEYCSPEKFQFNSQPGIIKLNIRPEQYTMTAYINYLGKIRKIYYKTIIPTNGEDLEIFNRINAPEVSGNKHDSFTITMLSWDMKTNRYTIEAVQDRNIAVYNVRPLDYKEVPHMARNERYNLLK